MMSSASHKYHLQPYKGKETRHKCPGCGDEHSFTLYVDDDGNPLDDAVGRCNHESGCGYHYTPAQFFIDNPSRRPGGWSGKDERTRMPYFTPARPKAKEQPINTIPFSYVAKSASYKSTFIQFLCKLFDIETIKRLGEMYAFGATREMDVIFWQIDTKGRVRGGKIMKYNSETGHRIKDAPGGVDWVHARMKKQNILPADWNITQCLFGEHLLSCRNSFGINEQSTIAIVESEKSAIIGAGVFPQYIWMATGGIGNLNNDRLREMKGRTIIIFPDVDGTKKWQKIASTIQGCKVIVSDVLEKNATPEEREAKIDIADWIISHLLNGKKPASQPPQASTPATIHPKGETPPKPPIWSEIGIPHMLHQPTPEEDAFLMEMIEEHPEIAHAIKELGLIVTDIKRMESEDEQLVNNNEKQEYKQQKTM